MSAKFEHTARIQSQQEIIFNRSEDQALAVHAYTETERSFWVSSTYFRTMTTEHITSADSRSLVGTLRFPSTDHLDLDLDVYRGGVALWGAVPAIYDTTCNQMDRGIHVHARTDRTGGKVIDQTFGGVTICGNGLPRKGIRISGMEAIYL